MKFLNKLVSACGDRPAGSGYFCSNQRVFGWARGCFYQKLGKELCAYLAEKCDSLLKRVAEGAKLKEIESEIVAAIEEHKKGYVA